MKKQQLNNEQQAERYKARTDACFVAEIRNALFHEFGLDLNDGGSKAATLLRDWEDELMTKSGWTDRKQLRTYFKRNVGAYLWQEPK